MPDQTPPPPPVVAPSTPSSPAPVPPKRSVRGTFADMTKERRIEVARLGGQASQRSGRGHRFTKETGAAAGRIGGLRVSANRDYMGAIGRAGSASRLAKKAKGHAPSPAQDGPQKPSTPSASPAGEPLPAPAPAR